jgi:DNA polymerase-3 subunit epsilon
LTSRPASIHAIVSGPSTFQDRFMNCPLFVAFDLETTGLMPQVDRVVEIGAVRFAEDGRELGRFEQLVNPERPMSPTAEVVHGISDSDLAGAPTCREVLPRFLEFLGDPAMTSLVAHNAIFDAGFLGRELCRAGTALPGHRVFDTLALSRRSLPRLSSHRLSILAEVLGLDRGTHHRALDDSLRVKQLWLRLGGSFAPPEVLVSYPIHDPQQATPAPHGWDTLDEAVAMGSEVRIRYEGGTRGATPRSITPLRYRQKGGMTYLVAYCHLDAFEKEFRLDRIRHCELVHSGIPAGRHVDPTAGNR